MSWLDGSKFDKWWDLLSQEEKNNLNFDIVKKAYQDGYKSGFKEARDYDPLWDAD